MGDITGGLGCTNGRAALEVGLGRVGDGQCRLWGSGEAVIPLGVVLCPRPQGLRPRANRRCSETPLREASDEAGIEAGLLTRLAGGPAREDLAHGSSSVDFFP
jgi:hypothetical protein